MDKLKILIDKLEAEKILSHGEFVELINGRNDDLAEYLFKKASAIRDKSYGKRVFVRGLIEFSNYCKNNCFYCGIRAGNKNAERYRLSKEDILQCCAHGYELGFRTFVLQGGEDPFFTDEILADIVRSIKKEHPDCAVTLSVGEKSREAYEMFFNAGADRYLLRHETANPDHYALLHPQSLSYENRIGCLFDLKDIGFQTGSGFMVGSPKQTTENLANDLIFLHKLQPHMVGIGPFISHKDTPFANEPSGTLELTLFMLGLLRLMLPHSLLPSTTALGTIAPDGRERGILAGANVVMPNLSPVNVRKKYTLYDNKICMGDEAAESLENLKIRMRAIGYEVVTDRGDFSDKNHVN